MGEIITLHAENAIAKQIMELEDELGLITLEIDAKKKFLLEAMQGGQIATIKTEYGSFIRVKRKNIKVNKRLAEIYLDSIGEKEQYMKLDETLVKKVFHKPDSNTSMNFINVDPPTEYLRITK